MKLLSFSKYLILAASLSFSANAMALEVGDQAPCVVLDIVETDGSQTISCIRDSRDDQGYTLIEFFSTTCAPCIQNIPTLSSLARDLDSVATLTAVAIDRDAGLVYNLLNRRPDINYGVALDSSRDAMRAYGIRFTPTLYIINKNNTVLYKHVGPLKAQDVAQIKATVGL